MLNKPEEVIDILTDLVNKSPNKLYRFMFVIPPSFCQWSYLGFLKGELAIAVAEPFDTLDAPLTVLINREPDKWLDVLTNQEHPGAGYTEEKEAFIKLLNN